MPEPGSATSHFEANLEALRPVSEQLAARLLAYHEEAGEPLSLGPFEVEQGRNGLPTVRYTDSERSFHLHSPYDPLKEASQYATRVLDGEQVGNLAVFFGMGLGYGVRELLDRMAPDTKALVFEPHWELFYLAFCHTDLSWLLTRDKTTVTCDPSIQGALLHYMNLFELASFTGIRLFSNPAFDQLPAADKFDEFADRIRYELLAVGGNIQTLMVMGEMQQMNIILNFPQIMDHPPFRHLLGAFSGKPAIIVSAGPSLEKNVDLLRELYDRALIIAVDTATKPLQAAGITPHVVVTGDPQEANSRHLRGVDLPETYLIAEPQSPIASLNGWRGPKFICSFHDNMMQWVDRVLGDRGRVLVWGSVAVMAYDVAVKVGADPIVFIGQDLSFPGGRTYVSGTFFETEDKLDLTVDALAKAGTTLIDMTDIYGNTVQTNKQMFSYFNFLKNRFEAQEVRGRTIINATEGGILQSPRVQVMALREAIDKHMIERFEVSTVLAHAHSAGDAVNHANLEVELSRLIADLRSAHEICSRGVDAVARALTALEDDDTSATGRREVVRQYNRVVGLRKQLTGNPEAGKIIEMANQAGIYAFARGVKAIRPADSGPDSDFIRSSLYHYHTLYVSTKEAIERLIPPIEAARGTARIRSGQDRQVVRA